MTAIIPMFIPISGGGTKIPLIDFILVTIFTFWIGFFIGKLLWYEVKK